MLQIPLPPQTEAMLRQRAAKEQGEDVAAYAARLLQEALTAPSVEELLLPFRKHVDAFLAQQLRGAKWVSDVPEQYMLARDPKDSKYLNLAIAAGAPHVVTDDRDLLELMEEESPIGRDFRRRVVIRCGYGQAGLRR
jgi:predicted nucleic acid-binding protein